MAELADAQVSEACGGNIVEVQVLSSAPNISSIASLHCQARFFSERPVREVTGRLEAEHHVPGSALFVLLREISCKFAYRVLGMGHTSHEIALSYTATAASARRDLVL